MTVPWTRLPKVRALGREHYDALASYRSWTGLLLRFISDPSLSASSRIIHPDTRAQAKSARRNAQRDVEESTTSTSPV